MTTDDESLGGTQSPVSGVPEEAPPMSFGAKLWNLYVDPRKTFASVRRNHEWVILWILVSVIAVGSYLPRPEDMGRFTARNSGKNASTASTS